MRKRRVVIAGGVERRSKETFWSNGTGTGHTSTPKEEQCEIRVGDTGSGLRGHRVEGQE